MSKYTCQCGESFAMQTASGTPRTMCPYCRRPIGNAGSVPNAESQSPADDQLPPPVFTVDPIPEHVERPSDAPHPEWSRPSESSFAYSNSSNEPPPGTAPPTSDPFSRSAWGFSLAPPLAAVAELFHLAEVSPNAKTPPLKCPRGFPCNVPTCRDAFKCRAIPHEGCESKTPWLMGLIAGGLVLALYVVIVVVLVSIKIYNDEEITLPDNWEYALPAFGGLILVAGGIGFGISAFNTSNRSRFQRAIASAAEQLNLTIVGNVKLDRSLIASAMPLYVPGESIRARMHLTGDAHEQRVLVVDLLTDVDHLALMPGGRVLSGVALVVNRGHRQTMSRAYLVVMLAGRFRQIPDFVLTPRGETWERKFMKHRVQWPEVLGLTPEFSKKYALSAPRPDQVQVIFTSQLQQLLLQSDAHHVQMIDGQLYVFRFRAKSTSSQFPVRSAKALPQTMELVHQLAEHLTRSILSTDVVAPHVPVQRRTDVPDL